MRFQYAENYVLGDAIAAITVVFALKKADCDEFHGNEMTKIYFCRSFAFISRFEFQANATCLPS